VQPAAQLHPEHRGHQRLAAQRGRDSDDDRDVRRGDEQGECGVQSDRAAPPHAVGRPAAGHAPDQHGERNPGEVVGDLPDQRDADVDSLTRPSGQPPDLRRGDGRQKRPEAFTDEAMTQMVDVPNGNQSARGLFLAGTNTHANEMYGTMGVCLD
jgi:hypothetical protein